MLSSPIIRTPEGDILCPECKAATLFRIERNSFFERKILPFFGLFPWECKGCHKIMRLKVRAQRRRKKKKGKQD